MLAYLTYFQIFAMMVASVLFFFFPNAFTYKETVIVVGGLSIICIIYYVVKGKIPKVAFAWTALIGALLFALYSITPDWYYAKSAKYESFRLVLVGQTIPGILCACIVSYLPSVQIKIKQIAPAVGLIFTLLAFTSSFSPKEITSGGYANSDGLNYQTISYLAAYAAGLNYYFILNRKSFNFGSLFSNNIYSKTAPFLLVLNFLSILIAGGRGGLVAFVIISAYALYVMIRKGEKDPKRIRKIIGIIVCATIIVVIGVRFAMNSDIKSNGFERIMLTVTTGDTNGRDILREKAIVSFLQAPVFGHGLGSVFYEIGEYSHNCITDFLVEIGLIGTIVFVSVFLLTWIKAQRLVKSDCSDSLWTFFLLYGLTMSLFSGYYFAQIPMIWSIAYILCYKKKDFKSLNYYKNHISQFG